MQLLSLQRALQAHLLDQPSGIAAVIVDAPPLTVAERLGIYRHAYAARLCEALNETYPILHQVLGDDLFAALCEGFIASHPSVHRSIRWYGRELADYLEQHEPYAAQPILSELARLEWLLSEVFDAADAAPLTRDALLAVSPDRWETLRLSFHPSLRRPAFEWNTVAVWQAVSRHDSPPDPEPSDAAVPWLIWRQELTNYFRSLPEAEAAALDAALHGATVAGVCGVLADYLPEPEVPVAAATLLNGWLAAGLVITLN